MTGRSSLSRLALCVLLGVALTLPVMLAAAPKAAKNPTTAPRTVADHFLLVPDTWLSIPVEERKALLEAPGTINDRKNGYISFTQGDSDSYTFTVFRKPDGTYLSGLCFKGQVLSRTGAVKETCQLTFLDFQKGTWTDVTSKVLPTADRTDLFYELPQVGTTIRVKSLSKEFELLWQDGVFKRK